MSMDTGGTLGAPIGQNRNARVAHIRKFVCVPPERGHVLRMVSIEEPPSVLGEWPRTACVDNAATAEDVDTLLREHAVTLGAEVQANLAWQSAEGHIVCTKRLRCRPELADTSSMAQAEAAGLDGSIRADAIQKQREHEAAMRSYFGGHQTQAAQSIAMMREQREQTAAIMREQRELLQLMGGMLKEQYQATHAAQLAQDKLRIEQRAQLDDAALRIRESVDSDSEESGARADLIKMVGGALAQAMPFIVQQVARMMAEPANTNAPPAPPTEAAAE